MKKRYQPFVTFLLLTTFKLFSQNNKPSQINDQLPTDTIFEVDTVEVELDPNLMIISKAEYDSLLKEKNKSKTKEIVVERTILNKSKEDFSFFNKVELFTADYYNIGIKTAIQYQTYYLSASSGYNFNNYQPVILGLGLGKEIPIIKGFILSPEIESIWYFPTNNSSARTTNNNHIRLNITYQVLEKLAIKIGPSIYFAWRNNLDSNQEYNATIHTASPLKPFYATETDINSTFDIGFGLQIGLTFKTK